MLFAWGGEPSAGWWRGNLPPPREKNAIVLRARALRREMTLPEGMLWQMLRQRPDGLKFRRQHPIGRYVVDFYCPAARLVIEVDGESHSRGDRPERDHQRDAWLKIAGITSFKDCGRRSVPKSSRSGRGYHFFLPRLVTPPPAALVPLPTISRGEESIRATQRRPRGLGRCRRSCGRRV